jgi:hypothetical protein
MFLKDQNQQNHGLLSMLFGQNRPKIRVFCTSKNNLKGVKIT